MLFIEFKKYIFFLNIRHINFVERHYREKYTVMVQKLETQRKIQ